MTVQNLLLYIQLGGILLVCLCLLYLIETKIRRGQEGFGDGGEAVVAASPPPPRIELFDEERAEFGFAGEPVDALPPIPKVLWTFWEGPTNGVVEYCIASWKHYNPGYKVVVLNRSNYRQYVDADAGDVASWKHSRDFIARFSDYVRCMVLSHRGGIWIDASIICHAPLDWVHEAQHATGAEFVGYYIHKGTYPEFRSYSPMVENWFFACVPDSRFMQDWADEFLRTNQFPTIDAYLDDVKASGTHFNNMPNIGTPEYLTMHISAQKILQDRHETPAYSLCLFSACAGPFLYLHEVDWDTAVAVNHLVVEPSRSHYQHCALVKLRSIERNTLESYDDAQKRRAFSSIIAP